jgi:spermidine/putrescine transport system substrate-binding protein
MVNRRLFVIIAVSTIIGLAVGGVVGSYLNGLTTKSREDELTNEIQTLRQQLGGPVESEVRIYSWSAYINDYVIELFKQRYAVKNVIYDTFESDEEVWTKVSTNASGYDVIILPDAKVAQAVAANLIQPLNHTLIPNLEGIDDVFKSQFYDPGNKYSVPYMWGTTGIGYDSSLVKDPITGWAQLFDFSSGGFLQKYSGKITMLDDLYETIPAALKYLGYSCNDVNDTHLDQAKNLLIQQKHYLMKYATADFYLQALADPSTTNLWIAHLWNGDALQINQTNSNIKYVLPQEGGVWWIDNMVIPNHAPHPIAAHAWINFMSDPAIASINSMSINYANPVKASTDHLLPQSVVSNPAIYAPADILQKFELEKVYTEAERTKLQNIWTAVQVAP